MGSVDSGHIKKWTQYGGDLFDLKLTVFRKFFEVLNLSREVLSGIAELWLPIVQAKSCRLKIQTSGEIFKAKLAVFGVTVDEIGELCERQSVCKASVP